MRRIGFLVNPIAGMGGPVGLKGTDDKVAEARELGAEPRAPERARRALAALDRIGDDVELVAWGEPMGAAIAAEVGLPVTVVGTPGNTETRADDTVEAVRALVEAEVDVILFVGGDGTAVDVATTLEELGADVPILGVPSGVKIFSAVFATTPEAAGEIVGTYERTESREVADIDEDAYRAGEVRASLRALARVPVAEDMQAAKQVRGGSIAGVVEGTIDRIQPEMTYFLGPGSTVGELKERLGIDATPLGIDVWRDGETLVNDASERDLLEHLDGPTTIVVSPIGGQGFVFGRGNQQFTPAVIRASDIEIIASRAKLDDIGALRVDTGDVDLDDELRGWTRVRIGRVESRMIQIV